MSARALTATLAFGAAVLAVAPALAETVRTKDGQKLVGTIVEETQGELVLRTKYGVLVIPSANIERVEGRPGEAAKPAAAAPTAPTPEAPALDLTKVRTLRLKARRQAQAASSADAALATYAELLALAPDDAEAHLEVAALRAKRGEAAEAVAALRKALLAGLADADRLRGPEFASLEKDAAFKGWLDRRLSSPDLSPQDSGEMRDLAKSSCPKGQDKLCANFLSTIEMGRALSAPELMQIAPAAPAPAKKP